jgi:hypothetical protein
LTGSNRNQTANRTTHLTGMVTDIGIELGKAMYLRERGMGTL